MSKGFTGLNPGNQAFKQFKCPVLNVLIHDKGRIHQTFVIESN